MFCVWRTVLTVALLYQLPSCLRKNQKKLRYGIDGVVLNDFAWGEGFDRGDQELDSNKNVLVQTSIYQFRIYH